MTQDRPLTHGSLFSGIGGFDLAAEWAGWDNKFHCEINDFGQRILKYYWPNAKSYTDIKTTDFTIWRGGIDVLSGGFPCQPYSTAGKRLGKEDERHLWPEMLRAVREIQPRYVVGENVRGLTNWNGGVVFDEVQADLEAEGYEVLPFLLPACGVNAPHRRDRIWFVAFNAKCEPDGGHKSGKSKREGMDLVGNVVDKKRRYKSSDNIESSGNNRITSNACHSRPHSRTTDSAEYCRRVSKDEQSTDDDLWGEFVGLGETIANTNSGKRFEGRLHKEGCEATTGHACSCDARFDERGDWKDFPTQPPLCSRNDGFSSKLAGITFSKHRNESIKGFGNAVVPELVLQIFKAINQYECST